MSTSQESKKDKKVGNNRKREDVKVTIRVMNEPSPEVVKEFIESLMELVLRRQNN